MSLGKLILRSLAFHWRTNVAVMLAVMVASAVLTGALLVGDSMRGSLQHLLLDQLGQIDEVLVSDRFFRSELADELGNQREFSAYFSQAIPAVLVQGTVENPRREGALRAGHVTVLGCDARFWSLGRGGPKTSPGRGEIVLNAPLASEIGAAVGDEVLLRIGQVSQIPPDSALGRKTETIRNRRLVVTEIIAAEGLGRFALRPNQRLPNDAFVSAQTLQDALEQPNKVNAIFVSGQPGIVPTERSHDALNACLRPTLTDFGIQLGLSPRGYVQVTSNRMLLDAAAVSGAETAFAGEHLQSVFTYLANTIASGGHEIPYSTICAIDFTAEPPLGPFTMPDGKPIGPLGDDEIVLNAWAAEDLGVQPGAEVEITFFEPESTHALVRESKARFRLKAIAALTGAAADPDLTPQMPGVTDRVSIGDWDAPFPFDSGRVRKKDEKYWDDYRTTPKAFISLAAGRKLWSSRFGNTTSIRFAPPRGVTLEELAAKLKLDPAAFGFQFMPVKRMGLMAAKGTTPFDALFVGFSFFIMVSALLLVTLLFRLNVEQRAKELGLLRAVGLGNRRVAGLFALEGLVVATLGSALGAAAGIGYAWLLLAALQSSWSAAIGTAPIEPRWALSLRLALGGPVLTWSLCALGVIAYGLTKILAARPDADRQKKKAHDYFDFEARFGQYVIYDSFVRRASKIALGIIFCVSAASLARICQAVAGRLAASSSSTGMHLLVLAILAGSGPVSVLFGMFGLRLLARRGETVLHRDHRQPLLYLRSFRRDARLVDDGFWPRLLLLFGIAPTYERGLRLATEDLGPLVAIGAPLEKLPPLGAARLYVRSDWQRVVTELVAGAKLVLFRVGETDGLRWEMEHLVKTCEPRKVVICLPKSDRTKKYMEWRKKANAVFPQPLPADLGEAMYIGFGLDWSPRQLGLSEPSIAARLRTILLTSSAPVMREALGGTFEQLDLPCKRMPIRLREYITIAAIAAFIIEVAMGLLPSAFEFPFLQLYVTWESLAVGCTSGVIASLATILWTLSRISRASPRTLLSGQTAEDRSPVHRPSRGGRMAALAMVVIAAALGLGATRLGGEAQAGAFFGSGFLVLAAGLTWIWNRLRAGSTASLAGPASMPIARLAIRNGARNPSRSTLTVGLIAAASFLIVALSAFRLDPAAEGRGRDSGSGGFDLVAECDQPIYQNLDTSAGRAELGFSADADDLLKKCATVGLRVKAGDDASCLNLYQPTEPRVLGISETLVRRGGFAWAASAAQTAEERANPWLLLEKALPADADGTSVVPVVLDFNTAEYSLHKGKVGERLEITDGRGQRVKFQIVGLLKNSLFQGDVLCGEKRFLEHFPQVSGYRFFLIDSQGQPIQQVRQALESSLGDYGFDAESTVDRLAGFFAVQNTYLSTFQSLGGLGLLLGTFGLATVQLRSVLERRGEMALMRATGFRRSRLARLVMIENSLLLVGGLGVGVVAALVAVLPHWLSGGAAVPWLSLALTLGLVLVVGLLSGTIAVRATLRAELLPALREE